MRVVKVREKVVHVHSLTGTITGYNQHVETHVHASGGGGTFVKGSGSVAPIEVSSTNTLHKEVFLEDGDGRTHALNLTGWNVPLAQGHRMVLVWVKDRDDATGPYVALKNLTTGQYIVNDKPVQEYCRPPLGRVVKWVAAAGGVFGLVAWTSLTGIVVGIAGGALAGVLLRSVLFNAADHQAIVAEVRGALQA